MAVHIALTFIVTAYICFLSQPGIGAEPHPCKRECVTGRPQVCQYNFTIEWYYTLSKACYKCPFVAEDCFRPHCVSADGHRRPIITVNRQMPGPAIEVCEGDTVRVWVNNQMEDASSTSIHWHGLIQNNTGYMDGVSKLTQCGIPPFELFRYEFKADNAGTHWYHAHESMQLGDGLLGPFIVRKPISMEPAASLYDVDSIDHTLVIQDWSPMPVFYRYMEEMNWIWRWPPQLTGLINGMGRRYEVTDDPKTWSSDNFTATSTPYRVFTVAKDTRYRFRLIGAMGRCYFRFSIDDHNLVVIATDGHPLKPYTVDSLMFHSGERYDVIVTANQATGNYWIRADAFGDCSGTDGDAVANLRYIDADLGDPSGNLSVARTGRTFNPNPPTMIDNDISTAALEYGGTSEDFSNEIVDVQYYIRLVYLNNDNTKYNHPSYYPVKGLPNAQEHITPTLNKITNYLPAAPLYSQWNDADMNICTSQTVNETECDEDLCYCNHIVQVELGQVVELFMVSDATDPHPMHLHGQDFRVVSFGQHSEPKGTVNIEDFMAKDKRGMYPRKLVNAPRMDTITVHMQSYAAIRFKADNPGVWFFHCHSEGHMMQGMSMVIKVGHQDSFPAPPNYFPRCGGYAYDVKRSESEACVSSAHIITTSLITSLLLASVVYFSTYQSSR